MALLLLLFSWIPCILAAFTLNDSIKRLEHKNEYLEERIRRLDGYIDTLYQCNRKTKTIGGFEVEDVERDTYDNADTFKIHPKDEPKYEQQ